MAACSRVDLILFGGLNHGGCAARPDHSNRAQLQEILPAVFFHNAS
jgi:hypothetical protein